MGSLSMLSLVAHWWVQEGLRTSYDFLARLIFSQKISILFDKKLYEAYVEMFAHRALHGSLQDFISVLKHRLAEW